MGEEATTWVKRLALVVVGLAGAWFAWGKLTGALSYEQVGPRPAPGRTVFILLHGYGAPGDDLVGLAAEVSAALPEASFLVPEGPHGTGFGGRAWIPSFSSPSRDAYVARLALELTQTNAQLWKLIDKVRSKGVACENIYLGGFSQGGRMAEEAALRAPAACHLGGLVIMSGGGINEAEVPTSTASLRVLVTHGTDDQVVGLGVGVGTAHQLAAAGHTVRWLEFPGQHQIAPVVREALAPFLRGEEVGVAVP